MNTMERLVALCTCLLLLPGVLVNIECPDVRLPTATASPDNTSSNITTGQNSTTTEPNAMHMNTTKPQRADTNQTTTNNSSTTPLRSTAPPRPPRNTTPPRDLTSTTRQTPTSTPLTTKGTTKTPQTTVAVPSSGGSKAGTVVFVLIILVAAILLIICCLKRNKSRRYSVDLRDKHEDAVIPLSTVEADAVFDATPEKEMETFTAPETSATSPEPAAPAPARDPAGDPEPEKGETASGSQEPLVSNQKPEKMDMVDLNDTEAAISTKTSMESLDDQLNDNNSNNYGTRAKGGPAVETVSKGGFYEILQSDPF